MGLISINGYEPAHLSYSTVSTFRMCSAKFNFEKIMRLEQRPGMAAIGGNAVHVATEHIDELIFQHGFEALDAEPESPAEPEVAQSTSNPCVSAQLDSLNADPKPDF